MKIEGVELPHDWSAEYSEGYGTSKSFICIHGPGHGYITVDLKARGFRVGSSYSGRLDSNGSYTGHGWKGFLVAAAVRRLSDR